MSNGEWLHEAIERIEERLDDIVQRVARIEGSQDKGSTVATRLLTAAGILVSLGIGLSALLTR